MLKLILCDDDAFTLTILTDIVSELIDEMNLGAHIVCKATSATQVLSYLDNNPGEYLFFLDIQMDANELNGLDLACLIRHKYPKSKLVFVTSHIEKTLEVLKSGVEAFGFIEKSLNRKIMIHEFRMSLENYSGLNKNGMPVDKPCLELQIGIDEYVSVPIERIAYVETVKNLPHHICYHTFDNSEISVRDTISNALELLGDSFILSHRSVIVNKDYVIGFKNGQLLLSNGMLVACAIRKRNLFSKDRLE